MDEKELMQAVRDAAPVRWHHGGDVTLGYKVIGAHFDPAAVLENSAGHRIVVAASMLERER